jgi:hypothetical protein
MEVTMNCIAWRTIALGLAKRALASRNAAWLSLSLVSVSPTLAQEPRVADPHRFRIDLYADFAGLPDNPRANYLLLSNGENGFQKGLYVSGGFDRAISKVLLVSGPSQVNIVKGFPLNTDDLVFARGPYGNGMLISTVQGIDRLFPDGTSTRFASVGTPPFGPIGLDYFQGTLLAADGTGGHLVRVHPNGSSEVFATIPLPIVDPAEIFVMAKAVMTLSNSLAGPFGGPVLASNFDISVGASFVPTFLDAIFVVSADGQTVTPIATGLQGVHGLTEGPGGAFGSNVFVSQFGTAATHSGQVSILRPDGSITPFVIGIDATDVVFDTENILGGGMFIGDFNASPTGGLPGKIYRVTQIVPEPNSLSLCALGALGLAGYAQRRRR